MKTCHDCKGSGVYKGFNIKPEPCQTCKGFGQLTDDGKPSDLPGWMSDYQDQIDDVIEPSSQNGMPSLKIGDIIFLYRRILVTVCGMHKYYVNATDGSLGKWRIPRSYINFNLTLKRWETT